MTSSAYLMGSFREFLRLCFLALKPRKHPIEGAVILRTAQRQHLVAIFGYPFNTGHSVASITYREILMALTRPW